MDRAQEEVFFVEGPVGQGQRLLLTQTHVSTGADFLTQPFSTVDDPGPGRVAPALRVLADQLGNQGADCVGRERCRPHTDSLGRLWLDRVTFSPSTFTPGSIEQRDELLRVEPATGVQQSFGAFAALDVSADRTRAVVTPADVVFAGRILVEDVEDVEGRETEIVGFAPRFLDDDFFFSLGDGQAGASFARQRDS